jgi:hypothetical protein
VAACGIERRARTPGVDRATVAWIETWVGVEEFLGGIQDSLKSGEFTPVEVRRVVIPKAGGKLRRLGVPTVADRVVQATFRAGRLQRDPAAARMAGRGGLMGAIVGLTLGLGLLLIWQPLTAGRAQAKCRPSRRVRNRVSDLIAAPDSNRSLQASCWGQVAARALW